MSTRLERMQRRQMAEQARQRLMSGQYNQPAQEGEYKSTRLQALEAFKQQEAERAAADDQARYNSAMARQDAERQQIEKYGSTQYQHGGQQGLTDPRMLAQPKTISTVPSISQFAANTRNLQPEPKSKGVAAAMAGDLGSLLDHVSFGLTKPLTSRFENYISNENEATKVLPGQLDPRKQEIGKAITGFIGDAAAIGKGYKLAQGALGRLAPNAGRLARITIPGAAVGAGYQAANEATDAMYGGQDSLGKRAQRVATAGAIGAAGDLALAGIGKAAKAIADRSGLTEKLTSFVTRNRGVSPELEDATRNALNVPPIRQMSVASGPLRNASNEQYINKVMSDIKPIVTERMTPPLENPDELARWLQPHLDASLNQIRKLPYEDMRELAEEVRSHMSTYDIAKSVAKERGYDLDQLLNNQTPSIKQEAERLRMGRVAGAIEPPAKNVRVATSPDFAPPSPIAQAAAEPAATMKGNWFTNLFGNSGLGISATGSTKRLGAGPLTTEGQIVKNAIRSDKQGIMQGAQAQARALYQNFVDSLSPLKRINSQTYETAMDAARANNIADTIVRDKFVTPEGTVIGEGLEGIFKKVARGQDKQFVDYLLLRHAKTRMERGERVYAENLGMTPEKIQARIDMYDKRHPGFDAIAKEWDQFNDNMLQTYGVKEGFLTPELYQAMRQKNPNYAPMRRQFLRSEKPGRKLLAKTTNSSFSGQKAPIKEVSPTGSVRNIIDPRKTTIESVGAWTNATMRNRVMQSMVDAIKRNPEAFKGVAEIVQKPKNAADLRKVLLDGGEDDFLEALDQDFKNLFKTTRVDDDNIVRAMIKGHPVYIKVHDPEIVRTLIGMGPQASNLLLDVFGALSNATKRGATGVFAPMFAVKGATMDLVQSAIQAKNPIEQAANTIYAIFSGIGDKLNIPGLRNLAQEYRRAGGEYSAALKGDRKLNKRISSMTRDPLLSVRSIAKGVENVAKLPFRALEGIGNVAENAPRMAAYRIKLKELGGERTPENVRQAMSAARESTTNFSRKGALSRDLEAFIPYNNAAVQGTYRVMKGFKDHPIRTTAAVAMLGVLPKMYEYMQFHDDPDYHKLPARERFRNLIISKNEDGTFNKIPMEPAYNSIGEMTIEALQKYVDKQPDAFKGAADALANAWLPPGVTGALQGVTQDTGPEGSLEGLANATSLAPFSAIISNRSFTGAPIVSQRLAGNSPGQQYDERTSEPAKWIGDKLGMAPLKVDYLIRAYGGDPARLVLPLMSDVGSGTPRNTLLKNFIVDPVFTNTLSNDFYSMKEKITQAESDSRTNGVPMPAWYNQEAAVYVTNQRKGGINKRLSALADEKRSVQGDKSLSAQQKADKLRDIQAQMNEIYLDAVTKMKSAGIP